MSFFQTLDMFPPGNRKGTFLLSWTMDSAQNNDHVYASYFCKSSLEETGYIKRQEIKLLLLCYANSFIGEAFLN
jgi:hypothetical protein